MHTLATFGLLTLSTLFPSASCSSASDSDGDPFPYNPGFDIRKVVDIAADRPAHSWEYGTFSEALLELHNPELSVFGKRPFPVPKLAPADVPALAYAQDKIPPLGGPRNGATGDPASLGNFALMLGKTNETFNPIAADLLNHLVVEAPRFWNGAISHRGDVAELWADFIYMAPPFMAYSAVASSNATLLRTAVEQCLLYRQILRANATDVHNVWHHIIGPQSQDLGLWATGNGWAAAGMARVLATASSPSLPPSLKNTLGLNDLSGAIKEILEGAMQSPADPANGLLRNYLNDTVGARGFGEVSGSAILAATAYRMAVLRPFEFGAKHIAFADDVRKTLGGKDKDGNPHVTEEGVVTPAVNPLDWYDARPFTKGSPEGQAFVVLMYAAWRDCIKAKKCKAP